MGVSVDPRNALLIHRADAKIVHAFASAGNYVVRIGDVTEQGGPEYAYRLRIAPAEQDFLLRVKTDAVSVVQGDSALVAVNALRSTGSTARFASRAQTSRRASSPVRRSSRKARPTRN